MKQIYLNICYSILFFDIHFKENKITSYTNKKTKHQIDFLYTFPIALAVSIEIVLYSGNQMTSKTY